jgi:hypothetical protein
MHEGQPEFTGVNSDNNMPLRRSIPLGLSCSLPCVGPPVLVALHQCTQRSTALRCTISHRMASC